MNDVTAVVLTLGEATTPRAISSVLAQTLRVQDIVVVENVEPFHRALNLGAARVKTPFFVQVDSDMILDPCCVAALRDCMSEHVGIVMGHLRDPLRGRMVGVKMFRTACFELEGMPDTISPDTDFGHAMAKRGWGTVFPLDYSGQKNFWHSFGEHRPEYTLDYVFSKHLLEGRRYRYRRVFRELNGFLDHLGRTYHPAALAAQVAVANGIFLPGEEDMLVRYCKHQALEALREFLEKWPHDGRVESSSFSPFSTPRSVFRRFYKQGIVFRRQHATRSFQRVLAGLHASPHELSWIGRIALCRGLTMERFHRDTYRHDREILANFIPAYSAGSFKRT